MTNLEKEYFSNNFSELYKLLRKLSGNQNPSVFSGAGTYPMLVKTLVPLVDDAQISSIKINGVEKIKAGNSANPYNFTGVLLKKGVIISCGDGEYITSITIVAESFVGYNNDYTEESKLDA